CVATSTRAPACDWSRSRVNVTTRAAAGSPVASRKTRSVVPRPPLLDSERCPSASRRSSTNWIVSSPCQLPSTSSITIRWLTASAGRPSPIATHAHHAATSHRATTTPPLLRDRLRRDADELQLVLVLLASGRGALDRERALLDLRALHPERDRQVDRP